MIDIVFMIESFKSMPLWLQIIICILSLVFIIGTASIIFKAEEENTYRKLLVANIMNLLLLINIVIFYNQEEQKMTNYFGKARLIKLFYHYISDRTEFLKSFKAYVNEFGKEIMFLYKKYRGSEWLEIHHDGYYLYKNIISFPNSLTYALKLFKNSVRSDMQ